MTSRDELLRLVGQLETDYCHCDTHPRYIGQKCVPCEAAAAIRELLRDIERKDKLLADAEDVIRRQRAERLERAAQEPVAVVKPDMPEDEDGWTLDKTLPVGTPLYAAPVPAVDLAELRRDAERYRWLRRQAELGTFGGVVTDASIDAARKEKP